MSHGYVLAPRVTQVQQICSVDIIFVKKQSRLPPRRIPPSWARARLLSSQSSRSTSRDGSPIHVRQDREQILRCQRATIRWRGAIGAVTSAMQASGIVVAIVGPGQHVAVVEHMARTIKFRYRCHELVLPFVMTHTHTHLSYGVSCFACTQ